VTSSSEPADASPWRSWVRHRLQHALAGELLRQGAGLLAISQVLRHQDLATTALYAKVHLDTLRLVAQPWPGGA